MRFGNYGIVAESRNFVLQKHNTVKKGDNKGKDTVVTIGYFGRFSQAIERLSNEVVMDNYPDVDKILTGLKAIEDEVKSWKGDLVFVLGKIEKVEG